mmetsp:Transcript_125320/g.217237  ORF Transcript_125320/g.217237 Transcript_125320/m.217237 type:complete len:220 (-) Transcript_125320:4574-5233(-)
MTVLKRSDLQRAWTAPMLGSTTSPFAALPLSGLAPLAPTAAVVSSRGSPVGAWSRWRCSCSGSWNGRDFSRKPRSIPVTSVLVLTCVLYRLTTMPPIRRQENMFAILSGRARARLRGRIVRSCLAWRRDPASFMLRSRTMPQRMWPRPRDASGPSATALSIRPTPVYMKTMCAGVCSTRCHSWALGRCSAPVSPRAEPLGTRPSTASVRAWASLKGSTM